MVETLLAVFAKYWEPGKVKTRLAHDIGDDCAASYYRLFLTTTLRRFSAIADARVLVHAPEPRREEFAALAGPSWQVMPQADGDLGARLARFLEMTLGKIAKRVVILGADSPTLPANYVERAFVLLESRPVVLGPSDDGGYYLVGASGTVPPIFDRMPWSQPNLLCATQERLDERGVEYDLLPPWYDVDDGASLCRFKEDCERLQIDEN